MYRPIWLIANSRCVEQLTYHFPICVVIEQVTSVCPGRQCFYYLSASVTKTSRKRASWFYSNPNKREVYLLPMLFSGTLLPMSIQS